MATGTPWGGPSMCRRKRINASIQAEGRERLPNAVAPAFVPKRAKKR